MSDVFYVKQQQIGHLKYVIAPHFGKNVDM